jgi:hypothetical protein
MISIAVSVYSCWGPESRPLGWYKSRASRDRREPRVVIGTAGFNKGSLAVPPHAVDM